jgi:YjbE family integral membrane protein
MDVLESAMHRRTRCSHRTKSFFFGPPRRQTPVERKDDEMETLITPEFWSALAAIVVIDLVLAGDNAIVIALAARSLPRIEQRRAILWGTAGAVAVRASLTVAVLWVLMLPGLMFAGGALLAWIAYRLLTGEEGSRERGVAPAPGFWSAMRTIVIADTVMGVDNVLGVAGAAHGSILLVVLGLAISIPIVVWGSTLVLKCIERFPGLLYVGGAVLAWTAAQMIMSEPFLRELLAGRAASVAAVYTALVGGVLGLAWLRNRRPAGISMETMR